jgi:hypothetical protein
MQFQIHVCFSTKHLFMVIPINCSGKYYTPTKFSGMYITLSVREETIQLHLCMTCWYLYSTLIKWHNYDLYDKTSSPGLSIMDHVVYLLIKRCKTCEETSSSGLTMDPWHLLQLCMQHDLHAVSKVHKLTQIKDKLIETSVELCRNTSL